MIYALSVLVTFTAVSLKGFQHKNVIGNHLRSVFVTSYAMAALDVLAVSLIIKGDWWIMLTSGTGAAFGMLFAIKLHDRIFK